MGAFAQDDRLLTFTSPLGKDVLLPEHLAGSEGISELYFYQLDLVATADTEIGLDKIKKLVGQKVSVAIQATDSGKQRYISGYVSSFEQCGGDEEFHNYRAYIVPNIWVLTLNKNTRVFQDMTVVDVIKQVLSTYSISPADETSNKYPKLEYCTQYRETDFAFISRLMEQFGIIYYFKHTQDDHSFTLQDHSSKLNACPIQNSFRYAPQGTRTEGFYDFVVNEFSYANTLVTGKYTAWDYGFVGYAPVTKDTSTSAPLGENKNESYDYADSAAAYLKKIDSQSKIPDMVSAFSFLRCLSGDAESVVAKGTSNAVCLQSGYNFDLTVHPQKDLNAKYVVTHIEHNVQQVPSYRSKTQSPTPYGNTFTACPFSLAFRSSLKTKKPVVNGMHTGKVVVNSGEDSHMDKYGRVNVQFWWDRQRKPNTPDNTWLRVAQSWAGKGWGTYYWPRVDDEVLIDFIEGDPDQPIVVGSVYNGVNMPKYDPAGQYTLSGILTRSSKGGGAANANELRFEDLKGKEQVYMNAERDYDLHVENSHHTLIGAEQHEQIGADHYMQTAGDTHLHIKKKLYEQIDDEVDQTYGAKQIIKISADRNESIGGNSAIKIGANSDTNVGANLSEKVGANYSLNVGVNEDHKIGMMYNLDTGMMINIKAGMTITLDAPMGVNLTSGGNFVNVTPAGVMIQGLLVTINSGGAAMSANSANPQDPQAPGSPTAPKDPKFPGDSPPSQAATSQAGQGAQSPNITGDSGGAPAAGSAPAAAGAAAGPAAGAANQAQQATQQAAAAAQQAANQAQQAAQAAQTAAQAAQQQAQQAVNQVTQQARQTYQQANQAVQQAQQAVSQAAAQGQQAAQQALNQAQQQAQQAAQQAAQAVQQAQQKAQQVEQQAQQAAQQAQQQAQQAEQQAQQAAQQAVQQGQQAAQQAQQQAQQAAQQAQQAAQQAQQQAQQAGQQVQQAAQGAQQQAQQAAQQAQQSAQQAIGQAMKGF
ncbi:MAG TPA: type VI secretion system tip protein TssI/VgrG [Silvibacterium sp.]|nr:type VI secretion system tip protein TssI/VgrG [Silvibacterium sp.]